MIELNVSATKTKKKRKEIHYPVSDGKPLAETDFHFNAISDLLLTLKEWFRDHDDVYVAAKNIVYYTEGIPRDRVSPDFYVVFGVPNHLRRLFKIWEEKRGPTIVVEVTSRKTKKEDLVRKKELYATLGVREYFLYDPEDDYLKPPLQGYSLDSGVYTTIVPGPSGALRSRVLDMDLRMDDNLIALCDASTGQRIWRIIEAKQRAEREAIIARLNVLAAEQRAAEEKKQSDAEIARLRAEIRRLKNG